ncbi:MAG: 2'-5' RNA ligase family protein [Deltaproteobacteria bacterium]|jgi:2'-5' RNA ligase|nr:2'-5' RNA ligase family protein [Deltaproteobacteria bacterium]
MKKSLPRIAFWLIPEQRFYDELLAIIVKLAKRFDAPVFQPHVTIYCTRRSDDRDELTLLTSLAQLTRPLTLNVETVQTGESLNKTLFLQLQKTAECNSLYQVLHGAASSPSGYRFDPHLSLLYQHTPRFMREALVSQLGFPYTAIRFDRLQAVAIPENLSSLESFLGWQTLLSIRLAPSKTACEDPICR